MRTFHEWLLENWNKETWLAKVKDAKVLLSMYADKFKVTTPEEFDWEVEFQKELGFELTAEDKPAFLDALNIVNHAADVPSNIYYWISKGQIPVGTSLSGNYELESWKQKAEEFLESYRKEKYPHRPSRLGSRFVVDNIEDSKKWIERLNCSPCYINKVSVEGDAFKADGDLMNFFFKEFTPEEYEGKGHDNMSVERWWEWMKEYVI